MSIALQLMVIIVYKIYSITTSYLFYGSEISQPVGLGDFSKLFIGPRPQRSSMALSSL